MSRMSLFEIASVSDHCISVFLQRDYRLEEMVLVTYPIPFCEADAQFPVGEMKFMFHVYSINVNDPIDELPFILTGKSCVSKTCTKENTFLF